MKRVEFGHTFVSSKSASVWNDEKRGAVIKLLELFSAEVNGVTIEGEEDIITVLTLIKQNLPEIWEKVDEGSASNG